MRHGTRRPDHKQESNHETEMKKQLKETQNSMVSIQREQGGSTERRTSDNEGANGIQVCEASKVTAAQCV